MKIQLKRDKQTYFSQVAFYLSCLKKRRNFKKQFIQSTFSKGFNLTEMESLSDTRN